MQRKFCWIFPPAIQHLLHVMTGLVFLWQEGNRQLINSLRAVQVLWGLLGGCRYSKPQPNLNLRLWHAYFYTRQHNILLFQSFQISISHPTFDIWVWFLEFHHQFWFQNNFWQHVSHVTPLLISIGSQKCKSPHLGENLKHRR